ncbi:MAG: protease modulator HflK [Ruminococcaceae bacterium]|nr:protease modulator HflK [Oscillospiraceae bacterium]
MKRTPPSRLSKGKVTALASVACLVLSSVVLLMLYKSVSYLSLALLAMIQLLPALVNLLLFLPILRLPTQRKRRSKEEQADPSSETRTRKIWRFLRIRFQKILCAARTYCARHRVAITAVLIVAATAVVNLYFFRYVPRLQDTYKLGYHVPVILILLFVVFIVFDKWCKHVATPRDGEGKVREDRDATARFDDALMHNLRSAFALSRVAQLLCAVAVTVKLLGFYDAQRILVYVLVALFVYETVFLMLSLFAKLIRREIEAEPEVIVPMPGMGGGDFSVLTYLEKNTGITMRSLWSMQLVKRVIPYGVMLTILMIWGFTGVVQIEAHQEGALYRCGKLQQETLDPGLHFTLPWPFDKVEVYDTKTVNRMSIGYIGADDTDNLWTEAHGGEEYRLLLGGGQEVASVNLRVEYRIADLGSYLSYCASPESMLSAASYEIITARMINTDLNSLLAADRLAFASTFCEELKAYMEHYRTGIEVVGVVLESIHPPVEVADVFQKLISAGIEAEKRLLDAEAQAGETMAWANTYYDTLVGIEQAAHYGKVATARSEVASFMASVNADAAYPDEYRYYKYLEAIKSAYGGAKIVIVGDGVNTSNIYIGNLPSSAY